MFQIKLNNVLESEFSISITFYFEFFCRLSHMISDLIRSFSKHYVTIFATVKDVSYLENCVFSSRGTSLFSSSLRIPTLNQVLFDFFVGLFPH